MPGAARLLAELAAHEVPTALVSASHRRIIDAMLRALGAENFALTVAGDEVARTKPHPDPYLLAAAGLGARPGAAARSSRTPRPASPPPRRPGCHVVAVPSVAPIAPGRRAHGRTSLEEVDLPFLRSLGGRALNADLH